MLDGSRCTVHDVRIVIMGCGRVGSRLARTLDRTGREVSVVDMDPEAFRRLGADFGGRTVRGMGFDRDTLIEAGIEGAQAFAAVSSGDNSNIIAARVARETFGVDTVVARIYDPRRAEIYQRLGITTVATVAWAAGQIMRRIDREGATELWRDSTATMVLADLGYDPGWVGRCPEDIVRGTNGRVAFISRYNRTVFADSQTALQDGDVLHVLCRPEDKLLLAELAAQPPRKD